VLLCCIIGWHLLIRPLQAANINGRGDGLTERAGRKLMDKVIRAGIVGYGNLGKGVEAALRQSPDFRLEAVFTRRATGDIGTSAKAVHISEIGKYRGHIDVMILCGGSATDLPEQGPKIASMFNTVDSFDTHARIPEYFRLMDETAKKAGTLPQSEFYRMGSGTVFHDEAAYGIHPAGREHIYVLG